MQELIGVYASIIINGATRLLGLYHRSSKDIRQPGTGIHLHCQDELLGLYSHATGCSVSIVRDNSVAAQFQSSHGLMDSPQTVIHPDSCLVVRVAKT